MILINEIKSKIDTLIACINEAHRTKRDDWKQSCWESSDIVLAEINGLLDDVQQKHDLATSTQTKSFSNDAIDKIIKDQFGEMKGYPIEELRKFARKIEIKIAS